MQNGVEGVETVAETFLIPPLPLPRCQSRSAWAEGGQNTWLCLCEGQAGSGLFSPAAVHARLVEGPVGICPWELTACYIDTVTLFWEIIENCPS